MAHASISCSCPQPSGPLFRCFLPNIRSRRSDITMQGAEQDRGSLNDYIQALAAALGAVSPCDCFSFKFLVTGTVTSHVLAYKACNMLIMCYTVFCEPQPHSGRDVANTQGRRYRIRQQCTEFALDSAHITFLCAFVVYIVAVRSYFAQCDSHRSYFAQCDDRSLTSNVAHSTWPHPIHMDPHPTYDLGRVVKG